MFRQIPVQSKICFQREHERKVMLHENKIKNMKKMIDNEAPPQYDFLVSRKKKEALQQSRGNEIQRENKILIHKLTQILHRNKNLNTQSQQNLHGSAFSSSMYSNMNPFSTTKNSLNQALRKKEFVKIVIENQALLKRIQSQKSEYDVKSWEKERLKNEKYISQISEYQYKDFKPNKTHVKMGVWKDRQSSQPVLSKKPIGKLQPLFKNKNQSRIIYKNGKKIGSFIYLVEIKVQQGFFTIHLENLQKQPNQYKIELSEEEGMNILINECNNDPELLLERIRIDEKTKSFFFTRNAEYQDKEFGGNHSQQGDSVNEYHNNQSNQVSSPLSQQNQKHNNLKVTEEKEEEDEQSIIKSKVNDRSPSPHQQGQSDLNQSHHKEQVENDHLKNQEQIEAQNQNQKEKNREQENYNEEEEYEQDQDHN
ncbi:hypothetical protein ABPG72_013114 [Tetrahymena utriculariae]